MGARAPGSTRRCAQAALVGLHALAQRRHLAATLHLGLEQHGNRGLEQAERLAQLLSALVDGHGLAFGRNNEYRLKVAASIEERKKAWELTYALYLAKGYAKPNEQSLWYSIFDAMPDTLTFVAEREGRTWEALSLTGMPAAKIVRGKFIASYTNIALYLIVLLEDARVDAARPALSKGLRRKADKKDGQREGKNRSSLHRWCYSNQSQCGTPV